MKKLVAAFILLICFSCSRYGENGDGNGNLKHEILTEKCETKPDYVSWLFLHPQDKTTCYQYYNGKKFSGTSVDYYSNGTISFIFTYKEGEEIIEKRKEYGENGTLIESDFY